MTKINSPKPCNKLNIRAVHYPFGMVQPGRSFQDADGYRYGFQGQEQDDEIKGSKGSSINYKYRMHDPRLGRFFSIDPLAPDYPWNSPYAFSENRVVDAVELEGLESKVIIQEMANYGEIGEQPMTLQVIKWSELFPGEEHGPMGEGTLSLTRQTGGSLTDPDYTRTLGEVADDLSGWFGGSWGTGGGNAMRDKGRNGAAADLTDLVSLAIGKMNKRLDAKAGGTNKLKPSTYKPGTQNGGANSLIEKKGYLKEYAGDDEPSGPSTGDTLPGQGQEGDTMRTVYGDGLFIKDSINGDRDLGPNEREPLDPNNYERAGRQKKGS